MLIKVRKLGATFGAPAMEETHDGQLTMQADMIGELVKVPEVFRERAELMVGELTMGFFPFGIDVRINGGDEKLNGLWVQREIYNAVRNGAMAAA